jgi:hypothetical protein
MERKHTAASRETARNLGNQDKSSSRHEQVPDIGAHMPSHSMTAVAKFDGITSTRAETALHALSVNVSVPL